MSVMSETLKNCCNGFTALRLLVTVYAETRLQILQALWNEPQLVLLGGIIPPLGFQPYMVTYLLSDTSMVVEVHALWSNICKAM